MVEVKKIKILISTFRYFAIHFYFLELQGSSPVTEGVYPEDIQQTHLMQN